jgi:hypothetical protein
VFASGDRQRCSERKDERQDNFIHFHNLYFC